MNLGSWTRRPRTTKVYYGWWVVAASSVMMFVANGIYFRGFSVFFVPLRDSLKLSNFQTSLVFSVGRAEGGLLGPPSGWIMERFGTRKLAVGGIVIGAAGYFAFSQVNNFALFALVYLGLVSLGTSAALQHAVFVNYNMWFIRRRAFTLSLLAAAASLGGVVLIPVVNLLTIRIGWEWSTFIAGWAFLLLVLPFTPVLRASPESMGLLPDGDRPDRTQAGSQGPGGLARAGLPAHDPRDFTVGEALRTPTYWLLVVGSGLHQLALIGILVNVQPILIWKGASQETVGYLLSFMMAVTVVSRLALGWLSDKWAKPPIIALCLASGFLGTILLLGGSWDGSRWAIILYLVLSGIGDSAGFIVWATLGDFFGRRRFASLRGIMMSFHSWILLGAPLFVGWWADHSGGDYEFPLLLAIGFLGAGAASFIIMRRPQRRPREVPASRPTSSGNE